jgi:hypothetical protein
MTEMLQEPVTDASAWVGSEIREREDLIYRLSDEEIGELDAALRSVQGRGLDVYSVTREDFLLSGLRKTLDGLLQELSRGRGFLLIRGFPRERYTQEECGIIFWGIGTYFGDAVSQNAQGDLLGHIRDTGREIGDPSVRGYQTRIRLPYHTDGSDVVGLFCDQTARKGGLSTLISSVAVHNRFLERRPDLLELMYQPFYYDRRGEVAKGQKPYYASPVYSCFKGDVSCRYIHGYIESSQRFQEVPRLTPEQREALALMDELTEDEDLRLAIQLEPGDMEFANNYTILHARTAFEDWPEPERKRHLFRLWLSIPGFRELAPAMGGGSRRGIAKTEDDA